jgi:hypothetical protein
MRRSPVTSRLRWVSPIAVVLGCTLVASPVARAWKQGIGQGPSQILLDVKFATVNTTVAVALNSGKIADAKIGADGMGSSPLDLTNLGKARVDVYIRVCKDGRTQVLLFTGGGVPPKADRCDDKPVGAFWTDKTTHLIVNMQKLTMTSGGSGGGNFFMTPLGLVIIGSGAATGLVLATNGDDNGGGYNGGNTPTFQSYNGTFNGNATKGTDSCGGFTQNPAITGTLTVNTAGTGTWRKTHISAATTFNFNVTMMSYSAGARFTSTTSQNVGGSQFSITDDADFTGNTVAVIQRFVRTSGTSCEVLYTMTLTRVQ